jgi:hypothetical protein
MCSAKHCAVSSLGQKYQWGFGKWHRPLAKAECAKHCGVSSLTKKSQLKMLEWVQFQNLSQTSLAEVLELQREAQSFNQG